MNEFSSGFRNCFQPQWMSALCECFVDIQLFSVAVVYIVTVHVIVVLSAQLNAGFEVYIFLFV